MQLIGEELANLKSRLTIMVVGPSTTGKTVSLATLAKLYPSRKIVVFDFDNKANSLVTRMKKEGTLDNLIVYRYGSGATGDKLGQSQQTAKQKDIFMEFLRDFNSFIDMVDPKTGEWKSDHLAPAVIAFDSLTSYGEMTLEFVLANLGHSLGDKGTDSRSDYGKQMAKVLETIKASKTLPCTIVWICHEKIVQDETTGKIRIEPSVTGKLSSNLAKEFNVVLYSQTGLDPVSKNIRYEWLTRPEGWVVTAGTSERWGTELPARVEQDYKLVL